jgi:hypothetical protein
MTIAFLDIVSSPVCILNREIVGKKQNATAGFRAGYFSHRLAQARANQRNRAKIVFSAMFRVGRDAY